MYILRMLLVFTYVYVYARIHVEINEAVLLSACLIFRRERFVLRDFLRTVEKKVSWKVYRKFMETSVDPL